MKMSTLRIASVALAIIAVPALAARAASPATAPAGTTAPAPSARRLQQQRAFNAAASAMLKDLASGHYSKRHNAMVFFRQAGEMAVPFLKKQLALAGSPQLRGTIARALHAIHLHYILGATLITMRLRNAPAEKALDILSKKTGIKFLFGPPEHDAATVKIGKKIDMNVTRKPFWLVMNELQRKTGLGCAKWGFNNHVDTFTMRPGRTAIPPEFQHGPFMVEAFNIYRHGKQNPPTRDATMQLTLFSEPKIFMLNIGGLIVDQATSDTGKSLLLPGDGNIFGGAGYEHSLGAIVELAHIGHLEKHIAKLRAHWNELVATRVDRWTVKNAATAKKSTRVLADGTTVTFGGMKKVGQRCTGTIILSNPANPMIATPNTSNLPGVAEQSVINVQGNFLSTYVQLLDAHGTPFSVKRQQLNPAGTTYTYTVTWAPRGVARFGRDATAGPPSKLVVTVPVEFQIVRVPVKFNRLRVP